MNQRAHVASCIREGGIYCLTAEKFSLGRSNEEVVRAMLEAGIRIIQYREKEKKGGMRYEECLRLRQMTREAGAAFIIDDYVDLAILVGADGVHIGQEDLPVAAVRRLVGENIAIGLSTHSPEQALAAQEQNVDYIGVGPIFSTQTKEDVCAAVGLEYLDFVSRNISLPSVAIGGIKEHNLAMVVQHGARCAALVTEIVGAQDISQKLDALHTIMRS